MRATDLLEVIDAAHLSAYVEGLNGAVFPQRGGILFVGPPGALKSTLIETALEEYPAALVLSDLNTNSFRMIKEELISGRYLTIAFDEIEKIYQRGSATAANVEGILKALPEQGYKQLASQDPQMAVLKARALVVGGMTYSFYEAQFNRWKMNGFARRFLWIVIRLHDPAAIIEAIHQWKLIPLDGINRRTPGNRRIEMSVTEAESAFIQKIVSQQPGDSTPYVLVKKILSVLKWKFARKPGEPMRILQALAPTLTRKGGEIEL